MAHIERNGKRKTRDQLAKRRVPELGYYFIVTDTEETEQNYMHGLRDSIPKELQDKLVIKVIKTKSNNLVDEARNLASVNPQYGEIWIIFDRDEVKNFDEIIRQATPIQIRIEEEQIIISNRCILPEGWTAETLMQPHDSIPYNPDIANVFYRAGYIETWGQGIHKICDECIALGADIPKYEIVGTGLRVYFPALKSALIDQPKAPKHG